MVVSSGVLKMRLRISMPILQTSSEAFFFAPTKGVGFIAEVDLDYPEELHDAHNSYSMTREESSGCGGAV